MVDFINQLLGNISNQHTPIFETGGSLNPTLAYFLIDILSIRSSFINFIIISIILFLLIGLPIYYYLNRRVFPKLSAHERPYWLFAAFFILLTLLMPRMKPYSFILLFPPLYWLVKNELYFHHFLIIVLCVIVPVGIYDMRILFRYLYWDIPRLLEVVFDYNQIILLLACFLVILLNKTMGSAFKNSTIPR